ncbi:MAG: copper chaperone PCu(A)C [Gallionella sp.]
MLKKLSLTLVALLFAGQASAADVVVEQARVRATAPGQVTAMADLTLRSEKIALLIGVSSPAAESVELHLMTHDNGMMKMREVKEIALPAGRSVNLSEEGYHLMLITLKAPIQEGTSVPLTLKIQLADKTIISLTTTAEVKPLIAIKSDAHEHHH